MADLVITSSNVVPGSDAVIRYGTAGSSAIVAGASVYKSSGAYRNTDADLSVTAAKSRGIAVNTAASNQPVAVQTGGHISFSSATTAIVAAVEIASPQVGLMMPVGDRATGDFTNVIGAMETSTYLKLGLLNSTAATS